MYNPLDQHRQTLTASYGMTDPMPEARPVYFSSLPTLGQTWFLTCFAGEFSTPSYRDFATGLRHFTRANALASA